MQNQRQPSSQRPSSNSSSGNGGEPPPVPPSRPKRLLKQTSSNSSAHSSPLYHRRTSPDSRNPGTQSPGEIVSRAFPQMESVSGRTDSEKYRDLNAIDLVVVIDLQQSLLDKLNLENRELNGKYRDAQDELAMLADENINLRAAVRLKVAHADMDHLLEDGELEEAPRTQQNEPSISLLKLQETLTAQIARMEGEIASRDHEKQRLEEDLQFTQRQLQEKVTEMEQWLVREAAREKVQYGVDLEELVRSLGATVKQMKVQEEELLNELSRVKEGRGRLTAENAGLKEEVHRLGDSCSNLRVDYENEMGMHEQKYRADLEKQQRSARIAMEVLEARNKDLGEELQVINTKVTEERLRRESIETQNSSLTAQLRSTQQSSAEGLRHLNFELAQLKLTTRISEQRFTAQNQQDSSEREHHQKRWRSSEERLEKLREQLRDSETGWATVAQENARLLNQLAAFERENEQRVRLDNAAINSLKTQAENQMSLLSTQFEQRENVLREKSAAGFPNSETQLDVVFRGQCELIERFKAECQHLTEKLGSSRQVHKKEVKQIMNMNKDLVEKYSDAIDFNRQVLAECRRFGMHLPVVPTIGESDT